MFKTVQWKFCEEFSTVADMENVVIMAIINVLFACWDDSGVINMHFCLAKIIVSPGHEKEEETIYTLKINQKVFF